MAVASRFGENHMQEALIELSRGTDGVDEQLQRFGEKFLAFISKPQSLAIHRVITAGSAQSNAGQLFYQAGPRKAIEAIAVYMQGAMDKQQLRPLDPLVATFHLLSLMQAEVMPLGMLGMPVRVTRLRLQGVVTRAVAVFMAAYGPMSPG